MAHTHDRRGVDYSCYGCKDPSKSGDIMDIKQHKGYGHGLRPGTDHDMNCPSCKKERSATMDDATKNNFPKEADYDNYGAYAEAVGVWETTHIHRTHEGVPVKVGAKFWDNNLRVVEVTRVGDGYSRVYGDCPEIQTWHKTTGGSSDTMTGGMIGRLARRFEGKDAESYPPGTNYSEVR